MNELQELIEVSQKRMEGVHPTLQNRVLTLVEVLYEDGLRFAAFQGIRSIDHQAALYAQGRKPYDVIVQLRIKAGLRPTAIAPSEAEKRVTNVRYSYHNFGLAVDLVEDGDPKKAGIQWSWKTIPHYRKIGMYAKALHIGWGGFWKSWKDYPHVQLTGGLRLSEAIVLYKKDNRLERVHGEVSLRLAALGMKIAA